MNPVSQESMQKYFKGDLTTNQIDSLNIDSRFSYIVHKIIESQGAKIKWFDYENECGDGNGGYFDPFEYKLEIIFTGEFLHLKKDMVYEESFPTRWLWENFEEELEKEIKQNAKNVINKREKSKADRLRRKIEKEALIESALKKITPEEAKALGYRFPKKVKK